MGWLHSWSTHGNGLGFTDFSGDVGDGSRIVIAASTGYEAFPMFSPYGNWVAYEVGREGRTHIYVKRFPEGEGRQISVDGGRGPVWNRDGTELYYSQGMGMMMVRIDTRGGLEASPEELLFEGPFYEYLHDVSSDGQRFAMIRYDPSILRRIHMVEASLALDGTSSR